MKEPQSPMPEEPRRKVCERVLSGWQAGMPLICPDDNAPYGANGTNESKRLVVQSLSRFDKWVEGTLWYVAAP